MVFTRDRVGARVRRRQARFRPTTRRPRTTKRTGAREDAKVLPPDEPHPFEEDHPARRRGRRRYVERKRHERPLRPAELVEAYERRHEREVVRAPPIEPAQQRTSLLARVR